jgi:hypothetical protein
MYLDFGRLEFAGVTLEDKKERHSAGDYQIRQAGRTAFD